MPADYIFHILSSNNNYAFIIYQFRIKPVLLRSLIGARERDSSLLVSFEPPANLMNITITPFFAIFLFHPKSWSILDWLFLRFKLPFLTIRKTRCAVRFEKRAIWLPKTRNADNVIKLNSRRIEYLKIKRTAFQISQGNSGAFLPWKRSSFQLRPS